MLITDSYIIQLQQHTTNHFELHSALNIQPFCSTKIIYYAHESVQFERFWTLHQINPVMAREPNISNQTPFDSSNFKKLFLLCLDFSEVVALLHGSQLEQSVWAKQRRAELHVNLTSRVKRGDTTRKTLPLMVTVQTQQIGD